MEDTVEFISDEIYIKEIEMNATAAAAYTVIIIAMHARKKHQRTR